jgi:hypothetical protein
VIAVSGTLLCEIITLANDPHDTMEDSDDLRYDLLTWRSKLKKVRNPFVSVELISSTAGHTAYKRNL